MFKKPNILILLVFMTSMIITSCVEEFVIEDKDFESKLVINELFENDSPWSVEVSTSSNILDKGSENIKITFAVVKVYDQTDKYLYDLYHQGNGIYGNGDYSPSEKRGYSIKVSAPGYRAVTASSFVPAKSTLVINDVSITQNDKRDDVEVDFEIEDKSMLESYYVWEVVSLEDDNGGTSSNANTQLSDTWFNELNNPDNLVNFDRDILGGGEFGDGTYQGTYSSFEGNRRIGFISSVKKTLSDDLVSSAGHSDEATTTSHMGNPSIGDPNEIDVQINPKGDDTNADGDEESKEVYMYELRVMSISKELYNFYSSYEEYYQNGNISNSEQTSFKAYTNVSNGLGIFAGFSESVIQFGEN